VGITTLYFFFRKSANRKIFNNIIGRLPFTRKKNNNYFATK
jgi:hypothetical protein